MSKRAVLAMVVALASCNSDGKTLRDTIFDPPVPIGTTPPSTFPPSPIPPTVPSSVGAVSGSGSGGLIESAMITFIRLDSPANATAEIEGFGAVPGDPVTVDGLPADVRSFESDATGAFSVQVWIESEGAHTVCVADTCGRVYTLAPDAETPEEVIAKIEAAIPLAAEYVDPATEFPAWTIDIGGALSGTGGTTDVDTKTVTIYRNRGRSIDDFIRTVLHELGHVADFERLDDAERARYLTIRGIDPKLAWRDENAHRLDDWSRQPSEDFAEAMVMLWTAGRWEPRTSTLAAAPSPEQLAAIAQLVTG